MGANEGQVPTRDLTVQEAAAYLNVDAKAVYAYIANGELPNAWNKAEDPKSSRPRWRVPVDDLVQFKQRRAVCPQAKRQPAKRLRVPNAF